MTPSLAGSKTADVNEMELRDFASSVLIGEHLDKSAVVSLSFVSEADMAELNERYMGKSGPTDVLSFPIEDASPDQPPVRREGWPTLELGDVVICVDVVGRHADEFGVSLRSELHLMVVHGVLHVLGWNHENEREAERMEQREAEHLRRVGMERR